ncbi:MAG: HAD-IA family hydrolase [Patescibacteria group bacterium]
MIKAIIFDLNGIFIKSRKLGNRFEKDFNVPPSVFLPKLFEIMGKIRKPNAGSAFSYWEPCLKEWNINFTEKEFWDYWFKAEIPSEKMIIFAKKLKEKGKKVIILSNNFKERALYYDHYPWVHNVVDKVYFSWQTGFIKPDIRAWELVLSENNLKVNECIYFDDKEENLEAAESIGIKSFLFTTEAELEEIVNKYLLL